MPKTVQVPEPFEPLFEQAESYVDNFFKELRREPTKGTIHVGGQRYVLVRGESLYIALFDQLTKAFGDEQASELIYNMARVIGRSDSAAFSKDREITDPNAKLSTGPVHFAYTGWAFVNIYAIHEIVSRYSGLADAILRAQCRIYGKEPKQISNTDLEGLADGIGQAIGMFTNPRKGAQAREEIMALSSDSPKR